MTVPYIFALQAGTIALSELDVNFANVKAYAETSGTVTTTAQPNITSVGILTQLVANGNVTTSGTVFSGSLVVATSSDFNNKVIGNVAQPIEASDVATKSYVDNTVSAGGFEITDGVATDEVNTGDTVSFAGDTNISISVDQVSGTETSVTVSLNNTISAIGNIGAIGNISGAYILGNGSQLTGLPATYANSNVASYLASGTVSTAINTTNVISATGNVQAGNLRTTGLVSATGNISATYFVGNGSQLTGLSTSNYANSNVASYLASGTVTTAITTTNTITGAYFIGDGSLITNLPIQPNEYGNANVASYLSSGAVSTAIKTTSTISSVGSVTGLQFNGSGAGLTSIPAANISGTIASATSATTAGTVTTAAQGNITSVGTLTSLNSGAISSSGTVTGSQFNGSGIGLTLIPGANVTGTVPSATLATTAGTVTTAAQPNITSVGILTVLNSSGAISSTGTITGTEFIGDGSQLTGIGSNYGNAEVATYLASGTVTTAINTTSTISATGNITGEYFIGNGSLLSGITINYGDAQVAEYLPTYTGNLNGNNLTLSGTASVTGNINGNLTGTTTGIHNGLIYSFDIRELSWDFGYITNIFTNPIQFLLDGAGPIDMGSVVAPSSVSIDIGILTN